MADMFFYFRLKADRMAFDEFISECIAESIEFAKSSSNGMICFVNAASSGELATTNNLS